MRIKLLHLYYDICNMYGENGNIRCIIKYFSDNNIKYSIDYKSLYDDIKFSDYDFIYIGTCLDENYNLVLGDLKRYSKDIIDYINNNKYLLVTGNALNLFSDLKILDFKIKNDDFRIVGEQVYDCKLINKKVIGFQNRDSIIYDCKEDSLFTCLSGCGYSPNDNNEGIKHNNFYGTYLIGPFLVRNPYFFDYLMKGLLDSKYIKRDSKDYSYIAYNNYINNIIDK